MRAADPGRAAHLTGALLAARAGLDMVHVPYREGRRPPTDLLAGQVQMYFGNASEFVPHAKSNEKVRLIAASTSKRIPPASQRRGGRRSLPRFQAAAGTALSRRPAHRARSSSCSARESVAAAKDPRIVQRLTELGIEPGGTMLDDFAGDIEESRPAYAEAVQAAGLKMPE